VNGNRATVRKKDLKIFISNGPLLRPRPHARPIRRRGVATAEAFAYAWEHWERVRQMPNALGYLFRVAQSRRRRRRVPVLYDVAGWPDHLFEPGLPDALAALSCRQRLVVVLVHGLGYTLHEVAELTGMRRTTVQNHGDRGMARLRRKLGVTDGN
jgi:DNA-directed RNA polymerase specialized sigma24 family protein